MFRFTRVHNMTSSVLAVLAAGRASRGPAAPDDGRNDWQFASGYPRPYQAWYPKSKIRLIYNGVKVSSTLPERGEARRELHLDDDALVGVMVANLIPYKGHRDLIHGLAHVEKIPASAPSFNHLLPSTVSGIAYSFSANGLIFPGFLQRGSPSCWHFSAVEGLDLQASMQERLARLLDAWLSSARAVAASTLSSSTSTRAAPRPL